jgi:CSLREA domain-containing protein
MFFQHVTPSTTPCRFRRRFRRWLTTLLALILLVTLPAPMVQAASLTVNSLADTDNGSDGVCTLREAITAANNNTNYNECVSAAYGNDTITFSIGGTITLSSSLPNITDAAGLTMNGASAVTISGNNAVQVLQVSGGAALTLQNLVIANGNASLLSGGLYNSGTATINNSTFSNNRGSDGGGIFNASAATAMISNSSFSGNSATNLGGAVASSGTLTISNSAISGNSADIGGGITSFGGTATVSNSTISGNSASPLAGGLLNNGGTMTINNSTISSNSASSGGGIYNGSDGTMTVNNSTISGNSASSTFGGGLYNNGGTATIGNSTISGNNSADSGGGMFNGISGTITISNSTISSNSANTGGGLRNFSGTMTLANSIVANSPLGGNCAGTITNGGHNLDSFTTCGWGSSNGSLSSSDPKLGSLANNGGPTQTHALLTGSPAINAGNNSLIPADVTDQDGDSNASEPLPFDQRGPGFPRIVGSIVDIGAFEAGAQVYLPIVSK